MITVYRTAVDVTSRSTGLGISRSAHLALARLRDEILRGAGRTLLTNLRRGAVSVQA